MLTEGWKAKLLEVIEADQLPEHYGGTLTDLSGDPRCPQLVSESLSITGVVRSAYLRIMGDDKCLNQHHG